MEWQVFLLTRDHDIEITTVGGGYGDVPIHEKGSLFHYADQVLYQKISTTPDVFGRNYIDQTFIGLCVYIHVFLMRKQPDIVFKSLTTRKEGDKYIVRVQYDDADLEMEVEEMFRHFEQIVNNDL